MGRELAAAGSPEDKLARQADLAKESFAAAVGALREVSELLQKSNLEAADVISKRMSDNFDEVKTALSQVNGSHQQRLGRFESAAPPMRRGGAFVGRYSRHCRLRALAPRPEKAPLGEEGV